jgi:hypothetical protein
MASCQCEKLGVLRGFLNADLAQISHLFLCEKRCQGDDFCDCDACSDKENIHINKVLPKELVELTHSYLCQEEEQCGICLHNGIVEGKEERGEMREMFGCPIPRWCDGNCSYDDYKCGFCLEDTVDCGCGYGCVIEC